MASARIQSNTITMPYVWQRNCIILYHSPCYVNDERHTHTHTHTHVQQKRDTVTAAKRIERKKINTE